jgi:hypothetical protein
MAPLHMDDLLRVHVCACVWSLRCSGGVHCGSLSSAVEGNRSLVATAVDAAGNPSVPAKGWLVLDTTPPASVLQRVQGDAAHPCEPSGASDVTVCSQAWGMFFLIALLSCALSQARAGF